MPARVTGYPFNVLSDPMYVGSTMIFVGHALGACSPIGFVLAGLIGLSYYVTLLFEG